MATDEVLDAISRITEPMLGGTLGDHGIAKVEPGDGGPVATLTFPYPSRGVFESVGREVAEALAPRFPGLRVLHRTAIASHTTQGGVERVPGVRNIIAVSSAKGGVGKSTVAANLAISLASEGARAGLLDADIHGPSAPTMMGIASRPEVGDDSRMDPPEAHGVGVISIGFMIEPGSPVVWRGPLVTRALQQLLRETRWRDLDYLVIDMPPGTGDIQLTLAQQIPVTGAVVVTTPQELALADARRGMAMFDKVGIPVLGVVENMGLHTCPRCGHESHVFGSGGAKAMCEARGVDLLGSLPLDPSIGAHADAGTPTAAAEPGGRVAALFRDIAVRAAAKIALRSRDRSAAFPKIVVSDT